MATLRLFQGTEFSFVIDAENPDLTTVLFGSGAVVFAAQDPIGNTAFLKVGSAPAPSPDITIDDTKGELTLWIRRGDTAAVADYEEWPYYVELDPGGASGPYALDAGTIIIRPRPVAVSIGVRFIGIANGRATVAGTLFIKRLLAGTAAGHATVTGALHVGP